MCNDIMTSSHLIRDAIHVRCWQNTWAYFAGHLNATPAIIFHLIFPPQFPELGRVDRRAGVVLERNGDGIEPNKDARRSPSRAKLYSPASINAQQLFAKQKKLHFLLPKSCQHRCAKAED